MFLGNNYVLTFALATLLCPVLATLLLAQKAQDAGEAAPADSGMADPAKDGQAQAVAPRVLIIEKTADLERSDAVRQVVERLVRSGAATCTPIERAGKPVGFEAILRPRNDVLPEAVLKVIETLTTLGVYQVAFHVEANADDSSNTAIVICPADVTWRKVRTITEQLEKIGDWKFDVRVAANNKPVTPVSLPMDPSAALGSPRFATPTQLGIRGSIPPAVPAQREATVKVFTLLNARVVDAAQVITQLYGSSLSVAVDERTNSLIVRGSLNDATEVEALLLRLDSADSPPPSGDRTQTTRTADNQQAPESPLAEPAKRTPGSAFGPLRVGIDAGDRDFSISLGAAAGNVDELRQRYRKLDRTAHEIAERLRQPLPDPATGDALKSELRDTVQDLFVARQKLQRAELAEFARRLKDIQRSIEMRDRIQQQIINRRVDELLDPHLQWDDPNLNALRE